MASSREEVITIHSGEVEEITPTEEQWLENLFRRPKKGERSGSGGAMIPRVPDRLRSNKENQECYEPQAVSIGPYHRRKETLLHNDSLKMRMAANFIRNKVHFSSRRADELRSVCNVQRYTVRGVYAGVKQMVRQEREIWYTGQTEMGDEEFAQMMFLDGCFVLQFMSCCVDNGFKFGDVEMKQSDINLVQRDLVLVENQLPFKVLEALEGDRSALILKFAYFIFRVWYVPIPKKFHLGPRFPCMRAELDPIHYIQSRPGGICAGIESDRQGLDLQGLDPKQYMHGVTKTDLELIEYLHHRMFGKTGTGPDPKHFLHYLHMFRFNRAHFYAHPERESVDKNTYRSVKELKKVGIGCRPSQSWLYSQVGFSHSFLRPTAELQLPGMHVNHLTKPILLNLAAYELGAPPEELGKVSMMAASFICFMDQLIDDEEDVMELRSKGVLYNALGSDRELAELFNTMGRDLVPDPKLYDAKVNPQIDDYYYNHGCRIWLFKHIYHSYFKSPWSIPALAAALLGLGLTIVQTYCAIHPSKTP